MSRTNSDSKKIPKVIVVGGGPAGLMAAGQASLSGAQVFLIEKMERPGRKLAITGKGRCNLTNATELSEFLTHFGRNSRFLRGAFHRFFVPELLEFLKQLGIPTVTERGGRIFPVRNDANEIVTALVNWANATGVIIRPNTRAEQLVLSENRISGVIVRNPNSTTEKLNTDAVIIATGGASYPGTGSTGDGYRLAKSAGHSITPVRPALVPLVTVGNLAACLQGLSLKNVGIKVFADSRKIADEFGEMLFTHFGLSGPVILTISKLVVDALNAKQKVRISIDLKPALDDQKLDLRLQRDFAQHGKMQFKTVLKELLPQKLIPVCLDLIKIPPEKTCNQITTAERRRLRLWLKNFNFDISGHRGFSEAIITAGGVALNEVDSQTLQSKIVQGLYFAGEILDLDADTGGYNLQAAFSTGWLAGQSAGR
ncbi:MAG TPA: NAD(P)/FAD-dependent oxidoreductase [Candidatus Marinimicrobia bacterium]|nr:NAD(P)/FAD-dependent oxidoreductase [Candidatus Neomarinimicrobiota bacterium]HQK10945.1 NAD(P)/FAD-dependent oxidoreductase [Candidatus Neomarinimicrobiota bacterium]